MTTEGPEAGALEIIGHRGYAARFPENTLPSLLGALEAGCRSLEWDLQVSADGVPVLLHDETLDRTTDGRGPVGDRTVDELRALDAGSWFHEGFRGTAIPTLRKALEEVAGRVDRIYPEVKGIGTPEDLERIVGEIRGAGLHDRTVLISLDHVLLERVRELDPELVLGWVVSGHDELEAAAERVLEDGRALLDPDHRLLLADPERTRDLVDREVPLATWTVNDPADAAALVELGVRRIATDEVGELVSWARGTGAMLREGGASP